MLQEISPSRRKRWSMKRLKTAVSDAPGTGVTVAKPHGCDRLSINPFRGRIRKT